MRPAISRAPQRGVLAAQTAGFERAGDDDEKLVGVERLLDEVVGALLDRGDRDLDVAVAGDDDDGDIRVVALDVFQDLDAVEPAALEPPPPR
jgi:hypothetical protein